MKENEVSKDVLLDGARMMLAATTAGIAGFLKEKGFSFKEFVDYMGESFEGSLEDLEGDSLTNVMEHLLTLQLLPLGVEVKTSKSTDGKAEAELTSLPPAEVLEKFGTTPEDLLEGFGITKEEYEQFFSLYEPAARNINLKFKHQLKDDHEVISLEKVEK